MQNSSRVAGDEFRGSTFRRNACEKNHEGPARADITEEIENDWTKSCDTDLEFRERNKPPNCVCERKKLANRRSPLESRLESVVKKIRVKHGVKWSWVAWTFSRILAPRYSHGGIRFAKDSPLTLHALQHLREANSAMLRRWSARRDAPIARRCLSPRIFDFTKTRAFLLSRNRASSQCRDALNVTRDKKKKNENKTKTD